MHSDKCIRSEGDWLCAGGCRNDEDEKVARLKAENTVYKTKYKYDQYPLHAIREYRSMLFMGNGMHSMGECYELIRHLQEGLVLLSGLQQGPTGEDDWEGVRNIAKDIFVALTGEEVITTKKAKYP